MNNIITLVELCNYLKREIEDSQNAINSNLNTIESLKQETTKLYRHIEVTKQHLAKLLATEELKDNLAEDSYKEFIDIASID